MISVIIPMYNRAETIARSITSVFGQELPERQTLEVIVVDDASTDDSRAAVRALTDARIRLIDLPENSGANVARNRGIAAARGEYIAFQDSDDEWLPEKLQQQLTYLQENDFDLVSCAISWRGAAVGKGNFELHHAGGNVTTSQLTAGNFLSTQTLLMKAEILQQTAFDEDLPRLQDWDLVFRLSLQYRLGFLDEVLVYQYPTAGSISGNSAAKAAAVAMIEGKFQQLYAMNAEEKADFYYHLGTLTEARHYYWQSLKEKWSAKALKAVVFGK